MPGVPGTSKKNPLASPLYSGGTSEQDSKNNQGSVSGPTGHKGTPDPLGYLNKKDK